MIIKTNLVLKVESLLNHAIFGKESFARRDFSKNGDKLGCKLRLALVERLDLVANQVHPALSQHCFELLNVLNMFHHPFKLKKSLNFSFSWHYKGRVLYGSLTQILRKHIVAAHGNVPVVLSQFELDYEEVLRSPNLPVSKGALAAVIKVPHLWDFL